jgi:hypothetical protein
MSAADAARRFADRLDEADVEYAIGGALALGVWGAPRTTVDVDISVFVEAAAIAPVLDALERAGAIVDRADAAREAARIGLFRARLGRTPVDVYVRAHPHSDAMQQRRRSVPDPDGTTRWFISPEDLAVLKLFYGRAKDLIDLDRLFSVRRDIDVAYVRGWIEKMVAPGDRRLAALDDLVRRFLLPPARG